MLRNHEDLMMNYFTVGKLDSSGIVEGLNLQILLKSSKIVLLIVFRDSGSNWEMKIFYLLLCLSGCVNASEKPNIVVIGWKKSTGA